MSGKPKVYQGVRVKITVKELLQQRRARQAATGSAVSWGSSSIQFPESVSPPHPDVAALCVEMGEAQAQAMCQAVEHKSLHGKLLAPFDGEPISSVPNCCPSWQFSNCLSCEESPSYLEQLIDSCLQSDAASDPACSAFQPSSHYTSDTFQPVPLCLNQGLAASSPSSADLSSPVTYSCSPPQLSPLTPLPHSPAVPALEPRTYSCPGEEWSCHAPCPFPSPACCCTACVSQHMDSRLPQCFPCPSTDCMDYLPPLAVAEDFFRRDRSWDICYS